MENRCISPLSVIGLLFLSLTAEALQGKRCQDSMRWKTKFHQNVLLRGRNYKRSHRVMKLGRLQWLNHRLAACIPPQLQKWWWRGGEWDTQGPQLEVYTAESRGKIFGEGQRAPSTSPIGIWGNAVSSPVRSVAEPRRKLILSTIRPGNSHWWR